jgi:Lrp/AsnC family leucine-responsive transcriptional regulator
MDALDLRILRSLQEDNRLSYAELAERVASSPASCMRRVKRLRDERVIQGDMALIDPKALGQNLTVVVLVQLERERLDLVDTFKRAMIKAPEVTQCYMVTGDIDFVMVVTVPDVEAYDAFVRKTLYTNENVRKFTSMMSLHRIKFEPRVPIPVPE